MAKADAKFLDTGDPFPRIEIDRVGGGRIVVPDDLGGSWGVVLFYRSHW